MIATARRIPSSSDTPEGRLKLSRSARFSASASCCCFSRRETCSASARATFSAKTLAFGSMASCLAGMADSSHHQNSRRISLKEVRHEVPALQRCLIVVFALIGALGQLRLLSLDLLIGNEFKQVGNQVQPAASLVV